MYIILCFRGRRALLYMRVRWCHDSRDRIRRHHAIIHKYNIIHRTRRRCVEFTYCYYNNEWYTLYYIIYMRAILRFDKLITAV